MKFKRYLIALFLFIPFIVNAQIDIKLDNVFEDFIKKEHFSGNLLIGDFQGNIIYQKSTGYADERFQLPNNQNIRFDIASISKQFTAALILKLHEEGVIDLQATISDYLPNYRKDTGKRVEIKDLLTHQSGIPNYTSLTGVWTDSLRNHYSLDYLITRFCSGNLEFEPGSRYKYNNSGYAILAAIIEHVTEMPFNVILHEKLLSPLGLENTGISSRETIIPLKAYGYVHFDNEIQQANYTYMPNLIGAGNMYSTTEDLLKWSLFLHNQKKLKVLEDESYRLMTKAHTSDSKWIAPYTNGYGFGIGMFSSSNERKNNTWDSYFHSGHISGFSSYLITFKKDGYVVVILSNTGNVSTIEMNNVSIEMLNSLKNKKESSSGK